VKTLSIHIPDELEVTLRAAAKRRGTNRNFLVREALQAYLAIYNGSAGKSCFDLSSDLAGSLNGPHDLATNKDYMEGYGK
jgi:hypothetical protein